ASYLLIVPPGGGGKEQSPHDPGSPGGGGSGAARVDRQPSESPYPPAFLDRGGADLVAPVSPVEDWSPVDFSSAGFSSAGADSSALSAVSASSAGAAAGFAPPGGLGPPGALPPPPSLSPPDLGAPLLAPVVVGASPSEASRVSSVRSASLTSDRASVDSSACGFSPGAAAFTARGLGAAGCLATAAEFEPAGLGCALRVGDGRAGLGRAHGAPGPGRRDLGALALVADLVVRSDLRGLLGPRGGGHGRLLGLELRRLHLADRLLGPLRPARRGWVTVARDGLQQQLGHVDDLDLALLRGAGGLGIGAVGEHHAAERAARGDLLGRGRQRLVDAVDVDPLADRLLHPHARATGATAHGPLTVSRHLLERHAGAVHELARRLVHLVVAA